MISAHDVAMPHTSDALCSLLRIGIGTDDIIVSRDCIAPSSLASGFRFPGSQIAFKRLAQCEATYASPDPPSPL